MLFIRFAGALSTAALVAASITSSSSLRTKSNLLGTSIPVQSSPPVTTGSFFSSIGAPYIYHFTSCWSQLYYPTVVGTVYVTINQLDNTTSSTTIYHEEISTEGHFTPFSRTDTDAAGTVTSAFKDGQTVTYPTGYVSLFADVTWPAIVSTSPTIGSSTFMIGNKYLVKEYFFTRANGTCCIPDTTTSPIPYSTTVAGNVEAIDTSDPHGWNYQLQDCSGFLDGIGVYGGAQLSSIWANQSLTVDYTGCAYTDCGAEFGSFAPSSTGSQVVSILATTTATISSSSQTSRVSPAETTSMRSATTSAAVAETANIPVSSAASTSTAPTVSVSSPATTSSDSPNQSSPSFTSQAQSPLPSNSPSKPSVDTPNTPPLSTEQVQPQATSATTLPAGRKTSEVASSSSATKVAPSTAAIPSEAPLSSLSPITVGSTVISANSASQFIVSGQTLSPGSSITVSGSVVTAPTPVPASPSLTLPLLTIGSSIVSADSASQFVVGSQTLAPGSSITVSGTVITAPTPVPSSSLSTLPPLTFGSSIITANSASQFLVGSQTLAPGSSITVSGTVITAPTPVLSSSLSTLPPLTFGSSTITANSASQFLIGSQSLSPGQTATISGSVVTAPTPIPASPTTSFGPIIIGGSTISASSGQYVIGSQTLAPGSQITVSGTAISLASGGTQLVVGGSTSAIAAATGPGAYIWSGVGGAPSSSGPQHYLGSGSRLSLGATSLLSTLAAAFTFMFQLLV